MPTIEFNQQTFFKFLAIVGLGAFFYFIRDIFWILFVAFIFTSALNPLVRLLEKKGLSGATIIFILLSFLIVLVSLFGIILIPSIAREFQRIFGILPTLLTQNVYEKMGLSQWIGYDKFQELYSQSINSSLEWIRNASFGLVQFGIGLLGAFIAGITITVLTFYLLLDHDKIVAFLVGLGPKKYEEYLEGLILKTEHKLGTWMRGQLVVMLIMSGLTYLGLTALGIHSALAIALIAGLMEIVPFVGPTLTAIPAILIASSQSSYQVISVMVLFFILQQLEGNIIVPRVMNKAIGLHPIVVILAVTIGAHQGGPLGALLAIPLSTVAYIFFQEWQERRSLEES